VIPKIQIVAQDDAPFVAMAAELGIDYYYCLHWLRSQYNCNRLVDRYGTSWGWYVWHKRRRLSYRARTIPHRRRGCPC